MFLIFTKKKIIVGYRTMLFPTLSSFHRQASLLWKWKSARWEKDKIWIFLNFKLLTKVRETSTRLLSANSSILKSRKFHRLHYKFSKLVESRVCVAIITQRRSNNAERASEEKLVKKCVAFNIHQEGRIRNSMINAEIAIGRSENNR